MALRKTLTAIALSITIGALAACDTSEERAEKHYQSGLSYLEAGDVERALVEFRNVFKLNGRHKEARATYAAVERDRGNLREAFSQYLRLAEMFPDDADAQRALADIAAQAGDWETAGRYAGTLIENGSDDPEVLAIRLAADYGKATTESDVTAQISAAKEAQALRNKIPENLLLRRIIIDDLIRAQNFSRARLELDDAILLAPTDRTLFAQRLSVNAALGDDDAVELGLRDMVARFPDSPEMKDALVRWFVSRKELDKAETYLRDRIATSDNDLEPILELVRFLAEQRGAEAAMAELERELASGNDSPTFFAALAGFKFELGRHDEAIADMRALLKTMNPSEESRRGRVGLAQMLTATGNTVGARALVEEVLAEDTGDVEALKLKANWLILDDEVGEAIAILRRALDQNPRNASIMTLMAQAYERDGNRDLLREMLSMAVQASGRAPAESLRFAQLLAQEDKLIDAEGVIIDSLRIAPGNSALLVPLGQIYVQVQDWPRATAVAEELEVLGDPAARTAAQSLRASILAGQNRNDETIRYLQTLIDQGDGGLSPKIAILRAHLASGKTEAARDYAASLLAEDPENADLQFIAASVRSVTGDLEGAEAGYRALVAAAPDALPAWMALAQLVLSDPARTDEASQVVDQALAALPQSSELKWAKAGLLERSGDVDGAIAIYEDLYKANSANPIIANNLASLLSTHRTDPDSLARAEVIARRLRGSTLAPYQDTYGWIAYLRGNHEEALAELSKAASGLPDDPTVQYHLAMTNLALGNLSEAMAGFDKVADLVADDDDRAFVLSARDELSKLQAEGVTVGN